MKNVLLAGIFPVVALVGCKKEETPDPFCGTTTQSQTTECINQKIEEIKFEPVTNPGTEIYSYQYKGQTVYYITAPCCDFENRVYDANCNYLCSPDGGFSGNGDGLCSDFNQVATHKTLVWKDPRSN